MTAIDTYASGRPRTQIWAGALTGLRNFARKDLAEWFRTKRAFWTTFAAVVLIVLGVLAEKIHALVEPKAQINWDPSFNMLNAGWETMLPIFAVFTTMGLLTGERDARTLAWSLSMPLGRASVLLSKLLTGMIGLFVCALVIPDAVGVAVVRLAYNGFPNAQSIVWPALSGAAVALFLIVLNLFMSVIQRSQRAVTAVALVVGMIVPGLVASFWPKAQPWWPISMGDWVGNYGAGRPLESITPVVWIAAIVVLAAATCWRFGREEL